MLNDDDTPSPQLAELARLLRANTRAARRLTRALEGAPCPRPGGGGGHQWTPDEARAQARRRWQTRPQETK